MNSYEKSTANACHAIWDIIVMKYSLESTIDTYNISANHLEQVAKKILEKVDEYKGIKRA